MTFNSLDFVAFFAIVLTVYWLLPHRGQNVFLLAASYFFYGYVHPWFLALILAATGVNYLAALAIERWRWRGKLILAAALAVSLGVLGVYKYLDFFIDNVAALLSLAGLPTAETTLQIFLPVGISFYTFQVIGYTIDVYRGNLQARRDVLDFALFVSFFPQLVAGPIERAAHLLPQVEQKRSFSVENLYSGLLLMIWGFFQKLVVADNVAPIADKAFAIQDPTFYLLWTGALAFTVQILADFSAYTDIARGAARMMGFRLVKNFDNPYFSRSIGDFWRRWHMSLSYWFRDYVYIPLGGNRHGPWRGARNILITFLLSGLWHGASWNFVLWGGYHGLLVLAERLYKTYVPALPARLGRLLLPLKVAATFVLIVFGWMLFRESNGLEWIATHLALRPAASPPEDLEIAQYLLALVGVYSLPLWLKAAYAWLEAKLGSGDGPGQMAMLTRACLASALFMGILIFRGQDSATFIYFQF